MGETEIWDNASWILLFTPFSTVSMATRIALRTARAEEDPWAMMTTPLTPRSGLPP